METQLSTRRNLKEWLTSDTLQAQIRQALPKHCNADRFLRVLLTATQSKPQLLQCSQESLFRAFMKCSSHGLEVDGRRAHLVPYRNNKTGGYDAELIIDYKGLVECIRRSGEVDDVSADVVYENDTFEHCSGTESFIRHTYDLSQPRGKIIGAYSLIVLKSGKTSFMIMSIEEIESVRQCSKAKNDGPWITFYGEMCKKTVLRRHSKTAPFSADVRDLIEADDSQFDFDKAINVTPPDTDGILGKLTGQPPKSKRGRPRKTPLKITEETESKEEEEEQKEVADPYAQLDEQMKAEKIDGFSIIDWATQYVQYAGEAKTIRSLPRDVVESILSEWETAKKDILARYEREKEELM